MFTVLWRSGGGEEVLNAKVVKFDNEKQMVTCEKQDDMSRGFLEGDIYVMNENGKTVATYHIRPKLKN